jgi:hypothetical protein
MSFPGAEHIDFAKESWRYYRREPFNEDHFLKFLVKTYLSFPEKDRAGEARVDLMERFRETGAAVDEEEEWTLDVLADWVIHAHVPAASRPPARAGGVARPQPEPEPASDKRPVESDDDCVFVKEEKAPAPVEAKRQKVVVLD